MTIAGPTTTDLVRRVLVRYPIAEARQRLGVVVAARCTASARCCLALNAPVYLRGLDTEIVLNRDVIAEIGPKDGTSADAYPVQWELEGTSRFPRFAGHLTLAEHDAGSSWLQIAGTYERHPSTLRFVEPGELAIGRRIAIATAKVLLDQIVAIVETEAAVAGPQGAA